MEEVHRETMEGLRQTGGRVGAIAGAKAGAALGFVPGIEPGTGAPLTGLVGGIVGGTLGAFGVEEASGGRAGIRRTPDQGRNGIPMTELASLL
jgi:phage tail tape-measure protein